MAYQKLQSYQALRVIPSDTVMIPDPTSVVNLIDSTTTAEDNVTVFEVAADVGSVLTGTGTEFTKMNIKAGAIVYNTTSTECYTVKSVDSNTQITLNSAVGGTAADDISIYNLATIGCTLFVGGTGDVEVRMASNSGNYTSAARTANNPILFKNLADGTFMPIQVVQVYAHNTDATLINAMW